MSQSRLHSQTSPNSPSSTPHQEYVPSPPHRSPPRKRPRPSRSPSRSPSRDPYPRYDRDYDPSDRRDVRESYWYRHVRPRYYSPEPRSPPPPSPDPRVQPPYYSPEAPSPPPRYRHYSRDRQPPLREPRYRDHVYHEDTYRDRDRDRDYDRPWSRLSDRSSSRSSRRPRDRRKRHRRPRQPHPVSPSQIIPSEHVDQLFLEALKLVLTYRRPPFNISVISDYMSSINQNWSIRKTHYPTFSDLCRLQESRGHLVLARHRESVVIHSSIYEPDVLQLRPKDIGTRKRVRDYDYDHIDRTNRSVWDLEERAEARKERFRENKREKHTNSNAEQEPEHSSDHDSAERATRPVPESNVCEKTSAGLIEGVTDSTERTKNDDVNGVEPIAATTTPHADQGSYEQFRASRTASEACDAIAHSGKTEKLVENTKPAEGNLRESPKSAGSTYRKGTAESRGGR